MLPTILLPIYKIHLFVVICGQYGFLLPRIHKWQSFLSKGEEMNWKQHSKTLTLVLVTACIFSAKPIFAKSVTFQREYTYQASEADSTLVYVNRGIAYMAKGHYDLAIRDFNKALEIDPSSVEIYLNRGTPYFEKGRHDAVPVYGR